MDFRPKLLLNKFATGFTSLLGLILLVSVTSAHANLFRYKDANGVMVISHTIPNERVRHGYEIVDTYGELIQVVPAQLSEEEYEAKLAREQGIAECEKALTRVHRLYQNESDIDYAERQGLESMDQSITNIRANLSVLSKQREEFEARAGQLDISGRIIPVALLDNIDRAKVQEQNLQDEIDKRHQEKEALKLSHAFDRRVLAMHSCENGLASVP